MFIHFCYLKGKQALQIKQKSVITILIIVNPDLVQIQLAISVQNELSKQIYITIEGKLDYPIWTLNLNLHLAQLSSSLLYILCLSHYFVNNSFRKHCLYTCQFSHVWGVPIDCQILSFKFVYQYKSLLFSFIQFEFLLVFLT